MLCFVIVSQFNHLIILGVVDLTSVHLQEAQNNKGNGNHTEQIKILNFVIVAKSKSAS